MIDFNNPIRISKEAYERTTAFSDGYRGVFATKESGHSYYYLIALEEWEKVLISDLRVKEDEIVCRYETDTSKIALVALAGFLAHHNFDLIPDAGLLDGIDGFAHLRHGGG